MSESPYRRLLASNLIGVMIAGTDGRIEGANDRFLGMVGYTREELELGSVRWDAMTPPEWSGVDLRAIQELESTGVCSPFEKEYLHKDGHRVPIRATVVILDGESGDGFCLIEDLTGRKQAEAALRESEERHRSLIETTHDLIQSVDENGFFIFVNRAWCDTLGWTLEEAPRLNFCDVLHPDEVRHCLGLFERLKEGEQFDRMEVRFVSREGREVVLEGNLTARFQDGRFVGTQSFFRDITERKRTEEALRESEDRYRDLVVHSRDLICTHDLEGKILSVNEGAMRLTGYAAEALLRMNIADLLVPEVRSGLGEYLTTIRSNGHARGLMRIRTATGVTRWWEYDNTLRVEGVASPIVRGIARDITERKQAEAALREVHDRLVKIVATAPGIVCSFRLRPDGSACYPYGGERLSEVYGIPPDRLAEDATPFFSLVHPDDLGGLRETIVESARGLSPWSHEWRVRHPVRGELWIEGHSMPLREPDGSTLWHGIASDITERKQAQEELRATSQRLQFVVEGTHTGLWDWDLATNRVGYSREWKRLLGYEEHEVADDLVEWRRLTHPDDVESTLASVGAFLERPQGPLEVEFRMLHKSGEVRWILSRSTALLDVDGKPVRLLGTHVDITERKRVEAALQKNEQILRLFIEGAPAAMAMFDREMRYIAFSPRYLVDYGLGEQDLTGRSHYEVLPEIPERWKEIHRRCLAGATEKADEDPFTRGDGGVDWVRWEIRPWYEPAGVVGGIILFSEVITERKRTETTINQQLTELRQWYQATLGREDRVRQLKHEVNELLHRLGETGRYASQDAGPGVAPTGQKR